MERKSKVIKKDKVDEDVGLESRLNLDDVPESLQSEDKVITKGALDVRDKVKQIIARAQVEAKIIKNKAKEIYEQVQNIREQEKEKGFLEGKDEGYAKVTEELARMKSENAEIMENLESEALKLIYEIAAKVIGDAVKFNDDDLLGLIKQALHSAMGGDLVVFVNPADLERVKAKESQLVNAINATQSLHIKATDNVKEGGCMVESDLGTIDASLEIQLEALKKALGL